MRQRWMSWVLSIGMLLLMGCDQSNAGAVTSSEGIVGTWTRSLNGTQRQFYEDGRLFRAGSEMDISGTFWFEGGQFYIEDDSPVCADAVGTYTVETLKNGSLRFTVLEDPCLSRLSDLAGTGTEVEWVPAP